MSKSMNIIDTAKQLCASIASGEEGDAEGIMDDKVLMLKLICNTRCPREDDPRYIQAERASRSTFELPSSTFCRTQT